MSRGDVKNKFNIRDTDKEQHENYVTQEVRRVAGKEKWLEDNEARITELSEAVVGAMEEKTLIEMGMEAAIDIVRRGWANYPHVFESEWKQYQNLK